MVMRSLLARNFGYLWTGKVTIWGVALGVFLCLTCTTIQASPAQSSDSDNDSLQLKNILNIEQKHQHSFYKNTNNPNTLKLYSALDYYQSIDAEFVPIKLPKKSLAIGDQSQEIAKLRNRLHQLGDYQGLDLYNQRLNEELSLALVSFQERHGLEADGILGRKTVRELNLPIDHRIRQLEINIERSKNEPVITDSIYLLVNIPEYKLYLINNKEIKYETRVIVGKKKNETPVLSSEITDIVLNPYWNIPSSISQKEIVPEILKNPQYLATNNMKVLTKINNRTHVIDPMQIDWASINFYNDNFRIRQDPGTNNSLGRIKFIFENNYKVYLHDTPSRRLFARNQRAFSHGCVRVDDPFGLAESILATGQDGWNADDFYYFAQRNSTKYLKLSKPIPIHITYQTAWVDEQDIVHFRPDIYKRDSQIASTLYNAAQ